MYVNLLIAFGILVFGLAVGFSLGHVHAEREMVRDSESDARSARCVDGRFYYVIPAGVYVAWLTKVRYGKDVTC